METVPNIGSIRSLIKMSEEYFIKKYPNHLTPFKTKHPKFPMMIVDVRFINDLFSFKKADSTKISIEIAHYIASVIEEIEIEKPQYISNISLHPHTKVNFTVGTDINKTETLQTESLNVFLKKKESKVKSYREKSGVKEQWLLLVAGSLSRDSYEVKKELEKVQSEFDSIYLLDDFNGKHFKLK
jgi:hypothetical protein